jgi:hypothetical protein
VHSSIAAEITLKGGHPKGHNPNIVTGNFSGKVDEACKFDMNGTQSFLQNILFGPWK